MILAAVPKLELSTQSTIVHYATGATVTQIHPLLCAAFPPFSYNKVTEKCVPFHIQ